jgi:hypothetical protein
MKSNLIVLPKRFPKSSICQMVVRMMCVHFAQSCVTRHSGNARKGFLEWCVTLMYHRPPVTWHTLPNPVWHVIRETCFVHFLSDVSHRIVQCVTRHSGSMCRSFPELRVTQDSSDVTHIAESCVTSLEKVVSFISWVTCHTWLCNLWHVTR